MNEDARLEKRFNPCCGYVTDAAGDLSGEIGVLPQAGDIAVCFNCGAALVYVEDERNITRLAQRIDLVSLNSSERKLLADAQKFIRRRGRIRPLS